MLVKSTTSLIHHSPVVALSWSLIGARDLAKVSLQGQVVSDGVLKYKLEATNHGIDTFHPGLAVLKYL